MANLMVIFVCFLAGLALRRLGRFPASAPQVLNTFIIHVSLPALVILHVHKLLREIPVSAALLIPISMAWLLFAGACGLAYFGGCAFGWNRRTAGAFALTAGLGNTAFLGFPILEALYGPAALKIGVLTDQPGSFMVLSTVGVCVASFCAAQTITMKSILGRVVLFPPFIALALAGVLSFFPFPQAVSSMLEKISASLVPLALVSVGLQFNLPVGRLLERWRELVFGLTYKLALGPALLALFYSLAFGASGELLTVTITEAAMAPMITAAIVATEYDLDPWLANAMVGLGIPLSCLTVPAWAWILTTTNG